MITTELSLRPHRRLLLRSWHLSRAPDASPVRACVELTALKARLPPSCAAAAAVARIHSTRKREPRARAQYCHAGPYVAVAAASATTHVGCTRYNLRGKTGTAGEPVNWQRIGSSKWSECTYLFRQRNKITINATCN